MTGVGGGVLLLPVLILGLGAGNHRGRFRRAVQFLHQNPVPACCTSRKARCARKVVLGAGARKHSRFDLWREVVDAHPRTLYGDGVNNFIKTAVGVLLIVVPDSAVVPEADRRAGRESPADDEAFRRGWRDRADCRLSGGHDFGRFGQHHHDAVAAVLQLLPKIMVGTDIVHAVILTGVTSFLHFQAGNVDSPWSALC